MQVRTRFRLMWMLPQSMLLVLVATAAIAKADFIAITIPNNLEVNKAIATTGEGTQVLHHRNHRQNQNHVR